MALGAVSVVTRDSGRLECKYGLYRCTSIGVGSRSAQDAGDRHPQYTVARDQLQYADRELATHQSIDVRNTLGKAITRVITGEQDAQASLDQAQTEADAILSQYSEATPAS